MRFVTVLVTPAVVASTAIATAPPATSDCTNAGATTICSQGEVRGSGGGSGPVGSSGPYVPYPCDVDWYDCDGWMDFGVYIPVDPGPGRPDFGRPGAPDVGNPGRPGGGGGIGGGRGGRR